jgi:hypothetical protein
MGLPETKLSQVRCHMRAGDYRAAILMAAKFADLGAEKTAILSAREAYLRPDFQRQLRRDPDHLIAAGCAAMNRRYGNV